MKEILSQAACGCFEKKAESPKEFIAAMFSTNQETNQEKKLKSEIKRLKKINASLAKKTKNLLKKLEKVRKRSALILPVEQAHPESKKEVNITGKHVPLQTSNKIFFGNINSITKKR